MKKMMLKIGLSFYLIILIVGNASSQCYPTQPKTAAFATGGTSPYKNQVLWLTWGSTLANAATYPYGRNNIGLTNGAGSYASIDLGGGRFLCVEAIISNLSGTSIKSYVPGNFIGDSMDERYNIGGVNSNNQLASGIITGVDGGLTSFRVTCKASISGQPVRLSGLVIGDAESLAPTEYFNCTADGNWNVVEMQKNLTTSVGYYVRKVDVAASTNQRMEFISGNDNNTGAVSFLTFNSTAYTGSTYEVSFDVTLKGAGLTALALGLLPPGVDGGDAPSTYGSPLHTIDALSISSDNITSVSALGSSTNLNTAAYKTGGLVAPTTNFLGTVGPDMDVSALFSKDAQGDNNNGNAGALEEDAWPNLYKSFSYKAYYMPGNTISATIPYKGSEDAYITGWIDFNLNGVFEDSERVSIAAPASQTNVVLSWTVPANRRIASTYVRLRYAKSLTDILSPTSATPGGEVEDHKIYIQGPAITNPMLPSKSKLKP